LHKAGNYCTLTPERQGRREIMDADRAKDIIKALADGRDPATSEQSCPA
jgi:hypothetical protein